MKEKELKTAMDRVYAIGFKNGQIEMKNKILKKINRDWKIVVIKNPMDLIMHILKSVNRIKLSLPTPVTKETQ